MPGFYMTDRRLAFLTAPYKEHRSSVVSGKTPYAFACRHMLCGSFRACFDVLIEQNSWSPSVGMRALLGDHWELTVQGGFEPRRSRIDAQLLAERFGFDSRRLHH